MIMEFTISKPAILKSGNAETARPVPGKKTQTSNITGPMVKLIRFFDMVEYFLCRYKKIR